MEFATNSDPNQPSRSEFLLLTESVLSSPLSIGAEVTLNPPRHAVNGNVRAIARQTAVAKSTASNGAREYTWCLTVPNRGQGVSVHVPRCPSCSCRTTDPGVACPMVTPDNRTVPRNCDPAVTRLGPQ